MHCGEARPGDLVRETVSGLSGRVVAIDTNPVCLLRELVVDLGGGRFEEWQELDVDLVARENPRGD